MEWGISTSTSTSHHRHLHETRHYQQPTNQPKKHDANNNHNNILQIHFYDDTPSFEKDNVFFWVDGEKEEKEERERETELYNVEK